MRRRDNIRKSGGPGADSSIPLQGYKGLLIVVLIYALETKCVFREDTCIFFKRIYLLRPVVYLIEIKEKYYFDGSKYNCNYLDLLKKSYKKVAKNI